MIVKAKVLNFGTARAPELAVTSKWYRTRRHYVVQRLGAMSEARIGSVYIRSYERQKWISVSQKLNSERIIKRETSDSACIASGTQILG
jgi:hypothetical protein